MISAPVLEEARKREQENNLRSSILSLLTNGATKPGRVTVRVPFRVGFKKGRARKKSD